MARARASTPKLAQARRVPVSRESHAQVTDTFFQNSTQHQFVKKAGTEELVGAITKFGDSERTRQQNYINSVNQNNAEQKKQINAEQLVWANLVRKRAETDLKAYWNTNPSATGADFKGSDEYKRISATFAGVQDDLRPKFLGDFQESVHESTGLRDRAITYNNSVNLASETLGVEMPEWLNSGDKDLIHDRLDALHKTFVGGFNISEEDANAIYLAEAESAILEGSSDTSILDYLSTTGDDTSISPESKVKIAGLYKKAKIKSAEQKNKVAWQFNQEATAKLKDNVITKEWLSEQIERYPDIISADKAQSWIFKQQRQFKAQDIEVAKAEAKQADISILMGKVGSTQHLSKLGKSNAYDWIAEAIMSDPEHQLNQNRPEGTPISGADLDQAVFKQLAQVGLVHSQTKEAIENGARTLLRIDDEGKANPHFKKAYERYQIAASTGYIDTLDIGTKQMALFDSVNIIQKVGGISFDEAVVQVNDAYTNPQGDTNLQNKSQITKGDIVAKDITDHVEEAFWKVFGSTATYEAPYGRMLSELGKYQDLLIRAGVNPTDAKKKAIEKADHYENFGGVMYHNRGMALAQYRERIIPRTEMVIDAWLKQNPGITRHDKGDLLMRPDNAQNFILIDRSTRMPVVDEKNRYTRYDLNDFLGDDGLVDREVVKPAMRNTVNVSIHK
jgi:hypothetical protein